MINTTLKIAIIGSLCLSTSLQAQTRRAQVQPIEKVVQPSVDPVETSSNITEIYLEDWTYLPVYDDGSTMLGMVAYNDSDIYWLDHRSGTWDVYVYAGSYDLESAIHTADLMFFEYDTIAAYLGLVAPEPSRYASLASNPFVPSPETPGPADPESCDPRTQMGSANTDAVPENALEPSQSEFLDRLISDEEESERTASFYAQWTECTGWFTYSNVWWDRPSTPTAGGIFCNYNYGTRIQRTCCTTTCFCFVCKMTCKTKSNDTVTRQLTCPEAGPGAVCPATPSCL